jgi:chemotaxis protein histidine kinase CheA
MVDRLHALGGAIEMSSPPGQGTRLDVRVPWDARSFEHDNEE